MDASTKNDTATVPLTKPAHATNADSAKLLDAAVDSFQKATKQESEYSQKGREVWYRAIGQAHYLVGVLRSNDDFREYLQSLTNTKRHKRTSETLFLLKMIHQRCGFEVKPQTEHDRSRILLGLEAASVPHEASAVVEWLREEEDLGDKRVFGTQRALAYANRLRSENSSNKAAETRKANAINRREAQFESYVISKLGSPVADLQLKEFARNLPRGYCILAAKNEGERLLVLDVIEAKQDEVEKLVLNKVRQN